MEGSTTSKTDLVLLAGVFVLCDLDGANDCGAASPWAASPWVAVLCCPGFLDAPIVDVAPSLVLFALTIRTHLRENGEANQDRNVSGGRTCSLCAGYVDRACMVNFV